MQKVPIDKILIQPTVQYRWLEQNGMIEFSLEEAVLIEFNRLWQLYCECLPIPVTEFLTLTKVEPFNLTNHDLLFALFTGASYALAQTSSFRLNIDHTRMTWLIDR